MSNPTPDSESGPGEPIPGSDGLHGFLLSSSLTAWTDRGQQSTGLIFQGRLQDGRRFRWDVTRPRLCFFIDRASPDPPGSHARKPLPLRTLRGHPVDALYFESSPDLSRARRHYQSIGIPTYEADISATARHLMERGIRGSVHFQDPPVSEEGGVARFRDGRVLPSSWTPALRLLSLDVECAPGEGLYSISLYGEDLQAGEGGEGGETEEAGGKGRDAFKRVYVLDASRPAGTVSDGYEAQPDERGVLQAFYRDVRAFDPDVLIGWNVIGFDLRYLAKRSARAGLPFDLGVDGPAEMIEPEGMGGTGTGGPRLFKGPQWLARIPGRAVLDGIAMLRAAFVEVGEGYSLAAVSRQILGERKLIELEGEDKMAEITRRFREDKPALARYNLEDSRLAHAIFAKLNLSALAVRKAQLTGLAVDRMGGSIAAFDFLYLPRLHRHGFVADTESPYAGGESVPGGLVLEGVPGFFRNVIVLDFKSLYPSIIRTFQVDPLAAAAAEHGWPEALPGGEAVRTVVRGPAGPAFVKEMAILPSIVESLSEARERAKRERDASLSQAVKIIMNSFYGVLGNPTCRFHHPDLAGAITRTGQWILLESKAYLEKAGYRVIYGDTDSLFVHIGGGGEGETGKAAEVEALRAAGSELCGRLNHHLQDTLSARYGIESRLTMEFEKVFLRFFLPALRREERGSKKRYAGLLVTGAGLKGTAGSPGTIKSSGGAKSAGGGEEVATVLHFAGIESARSDWTALAKEFQGELLNLVFTAGDADPLEAVERLVRDWNRRLFAGGLDDKLEYRKGLSKDPVDYGASAPPHVRAARALDRQDSRIIRYVMTVDGPEPIQKRSGARPDYRHYADKQLAPIADMVLRFLGTSFATLTDEARQMNFL